MVQRPFSDSSRGSTIARNLTANIKFNEALMFPDYVQTKTFVNKMQRPKMTTILSSIQPGRGMMAYSKTKIGKNENVLTNELRLARNTFPNISMMPPPEADNVLFPNQINNSDIKGFYQISTPNRFFSTSDEHDLQSVEQKMHEKNSIVLPQHSNKDNNSSLMKSIFIPNIEPKQYVHKKDIPDADPESEKADFLLEEVPAEFNSLYSYNISHNSHICTVINEIKADIDAQEKFGEFNIEPQWMQKKHFWNSVFDSRYESLMRNAKWPPLKVLLIPRTHVDTIWKHSFERYHNDSVNRILSNLVKKLQFYSSLTFTWNEVSHLSHWWKTTSQKSRLSFRKLLKSERLEITTGGWVETDEATTHLFGLVHQLIEGHQWLKHNLNYVPKVAWLTNTVTHSPTMAYILSASGVSQLVITNVHYSWEKYLAEYQISDFIWLQNWDGDKSSSTFLNEVLNKLGNDHYPKHSVFTHYIQFNSADFKACGPNKEICITNYNFAKAPRNMDINMYNVKEKAERLLEQYSKSGTLSPHNVIMAPIGGPFRYESQPEFDYQYNNYQKIADFVNINRDIYKATINFGTPKDYFANIFSKHTNYPTLKGDFFNFADISSGNPAYWTGFFTTRPFTKILLRRLQSTLRTTELLLSFAISLNAFRGYNASSVFELLIKARENVARLGDRNVVSGTLTVTALKYAHNLMVTTAKNCWYIQELSVSLLSVKSNEKVPNLQKYVYRDGEFMSIFKTVTPGDHIYIFNSLSHERTEVVELITRYPNIRIVDHNRKEITKQINPIWTYNSDNYIKISRSFYKVIFAVAIPPMTLELLKIKETYDASQSAAALYCVSCVVDDIASNVSIFPFNIQPLQTGDIQLESYKHRLIFDEATGFLKRIVEKETNTQKTFVLDYGAFRVSDRNSGMFLFNTNVTKPLHDILHPYKIGIRSKIILIMSGQVATELVTVYGRFLQHTTKIYNLINSPLSAAIYIESKVDYEISPKNRELELFMTIQADVTNGNPPEIFTDNNSFQYTRRVLNISRRVESNMYPMTSMTYIQDEKSRLTIITDHAQGVTALQEGQILVMLDRRILFNDGRGTNEGLADSSVTCHRHFVLLENFVEPANIFGQAPMHSQINLPSMSAIYLANSLNYLLDIYMVDKNETELSHYGFLPLIKMPFPCDVALINYRIVLSAGHLQHLTPNVALMTLHRQGISCRMDRSTHFYCNSDTKFQIDKILRNVKAVYQTNLVGTNKGVPLFNFNFANFPPMELITLRIHF
ncbi:alpha-mannosidase 2-like isoform X2 [Manduca sexta]|nr:alpha-mannosidase 2-like isoform X2 [Manduca sexta]